MKRLHFFLLLAGILLTACGGDDDVTSGGDTPKPVTPSTPTSWSLEITSPVTRGLSGNTSGITPTWSTSDRIYVYYENQRVGVLHPKENKNNAKDYVQLEGNLDTPVSGAYSNSGKLSFYYQCDKGFSDYTGQDGTLATIASSFDYHVAENVPITAVDAVNRKVTVGQFNLMPQQAIARFSFTRPLVGGDVITIKEGTTTISSVTLGDNVAEYTNVDNPSCYVYVALPLTANAEKHTLTFDIQRGNDEHFYKTIMADKSMQNGKTYSAHLLLAVELNGVWWATRNLKDPTYGGERFAPFENNYGHCFSWGEIWTHNGKNYIPAEYEGPTPAPDVLPSTDDAAYQICGRAWRMPTKLEADNLVTCSHLYNSLGGVRGMFFGDTSLSTAKWIFLPAAGFYEDKPYDEYKGYYHTSSIWPGGGFSTRLDFNDYSNPSAYTANSNYWTGCQIRPVLNINTQ